MAAVGCGSSSSGDMGATPGGAQDNDLANTQIEQGGVPKPEAITVEGMLNAHDLPLDAALCEKDLCINAALGVAPALDTRKSAMFLQMGFESGIDPATFHRTPLNLGVVVDRSGSMAGTKLVAVRTALSHLLDQLNEADRLALVLFDHTVSVLLPSTPVSDRESIRDALARDRGRRRDRHGRGPACRLRTGGAERRPGGCVGPGDGAHRCADQHRRHEYRHLRQPGQRERRPRDRPDRVRRGHRPESGPGSLHLQATRRQLLLLAGQRQDRHGVRHRLRLPGHAARLRSRSSRWCLPLDSASRACTATRRGRWAARPRKST